MQALDFYRKNIEQVYKCSCCGQEFKEYEEMKQHCIIKANNTEVKQKSLM